MPRIPLFEIPNAPGVGSTPDMQRVQNIGMVDMSKNVRATQQATLPRGAFNGVAEGIGKVADAISGIAPVINEFGQRMAASKNYGDMARAEAVMDSARAAHAQETAQMPENQWSQVWNEKYAPMVSQQIEGLGLSQWAKDRIGPQMIQFNARQTINIAHGAWKKSAERDGMAMDNQRVAAFDAGDFNKGVEVNQRMTELGHQSPEQADRFLMDAEKKQQHSLAIKAMSQNPMAFNAEMEKAAVEGTSADFPWMQPEDILRFGNMANSAARNMENEFAQGIDNAVLSGEITTVDQLEAREDYKVLPEREKLSLRNSLTIQIENSPEGRALFEARRVENIAKAQTGIESFDASKDVKDEQYRNIKDFIRTQIPEGDRKELLDDLSERRKSFIDGKKVKGSAPMAEAMKELNRGFDSGMLGQWKTQKRGKAVEDDGLREKAARKFATIQQNMQEWAKANPEDAQDVNKVFDRLNALTMQDREIFKGTGGNGGGFKIPDLTDWGQASWEKPDVQPPDPDAVKAKVKEATGPKKTQAELQKEIDDALQMPEPDLSLDPASGVVTQ
jgi:5'-deoxynucleotidase YfbR-like HD superfamily hydrolase